MNTTESYVTLAFVHLSDIHFHYKWTGVAYDLDREIRTQLERDAVRRVGHLDRIDGILVSGDVAFSGKPSEYDFAKTWLAQLAQRIKCPELNVFPIPGNHDVDRDVLRQHPFIYDMHRNLVTEAETADEKFKGYMSSNLSGPALFRALEAYQDFAAGYGCFSTPEKPHWERNLDLGSGYTLRIRGINSALASNDKDGNQPKNQLFVGEYQAIHSVEDGVVYLTMCHHPSSWLVDELNFDSWMLAPERVPVQLFGHEHQFQIKNHPNSLRLYAGAVQPSRGEKGWIPRYNILTIRLEDVGESRNLCIDVWARVWNNSEKRFEADSQHCKDDSPYSWKVPLITEMVARNLDSVPVTASLNHETSEAEISAEDAIPSVDAVQKLVNSFVTLPFHRVIRIAMELGLYEENDHEADRIEQCRRFFTRAGDRMSGYAELWDAVAPHSKALHGIDNPFI